MKKDSIAKRVRSKIVRGGGDRLWTYSHFTKLPSQAVAAELSRLTDDGVIERVRKGVYYRPKDTRFGRTAPDPTEVAKEVLRTRGIKFKLGGLPAYNALGLTTQVAPTESLDIESDTRSVRTNTKRKVHFNRGRRVKNMSSEERAILDALRNIRSIPDASPVRIVNRIVDLIRSEKVDFGHIAKLANYEPPRVRALLGVIGNRLGRDEKELSKLRKTLNPTTTFRIGVSDEMPEAASWRIK